MNFSLLIGEPSGPPLWWGFRREMLAAWKKGDECRWYVKPLYSCGYEEPCRNLHCDFRAGKVNQKTADFHSFLRVLSHFCLFLLVFRGFRAFDL